MKPSEVFEGENSGLRKAFDEAVAREQSYTEKRLKEFDEKFLTLYSMPVSVNGELKESYELLNTQNGTVIKAFLYESIHQALAEDKERIKDASIEIVEKPAFKGKWCMECPLRLGLGVKGMEHLDGECVSSEEKINEK